MKGYKKYTKMFLILIIVSITMISFFSFSKNYYNGYIILKDNKNIGELENLNYIKLAYEEVKKENNIKDPKLNCDFQAKKTRVKSKNILYKEDIKQILKDNISVNGYVMQIDNKDVGVIKSKDEGDKVINTVKEKYLNLSDTKDFVEVNVNNKISYKDTICTLSDLNDTENLVDNIIKENNEGNKLLTFTAIKEQKIQVSRTNLEEDSTKQVMSQNSIGSEPVFKSKDLFMPTMGVISSYFGERWGSFHKGLDIAANMGTPIKAAFEGKVTFSGVLQGYGNVIILNHGNGLETLYAHCDSLVAKEGEQISKGQHIANVGNTGNSTGPHLHFEIKVNGTAVDPLNYIS